MVKTNKKNVTMWKKKFLQGSFDFYNKLTSALNILLVKRWQFVAAQEITKKNNRKK